MKNYDKRLQKIDDALHQKFGEEQISGANLKKWLIKKGHEELAAIYAPDEVISIRRPDGNRNRRVREIPTSELMWLCLYGNEG